MIKYSDIVNIENKLQSDVEVDFIKERIHKAERELKAAKRELVHYYLKSLCK